MFVRQPDDDVPDSLPTTQAITDGVEPGNRGSSGADQHDDAIGEARRAAKRLPLLRPIPGLEP